MDNNITSQAFPDENNYGISKRDYFAARALPLAMQMEKENITICNIICQQMINQYVLVLSTQKIEIM
jgi:hypothetical protein